MSDDILSELLTVAAAGQRLRKEKADGGWLLSAGAELVVGESWWAGLMS